MEAEKYGATPFNGSDYDHWKFCMKITSILENLEIKKCIMGLKEEPDGILRNKAENVN